ncbi:hypothetical protein C6P46_005391 [Rhodotorula mucilaginosa]|uniref:Acyl-CoA dehydrogenase n=1 Tax=Rhodotorula mucilaginosa TaxID=5537 RepID=A0A9P6VXX6_RHOMI|nr:hypothetical protein C6P46_005391 [Rhodotorula mucilaginosa]TKA57973.1 hypothetical protein B0A53_00375 [Rhodotorula sp. CCFEE 5036]
MDNSHPVVAYIGQAQVSPSPDAWAFVNPHFSEYAKDVLAKLIDFVENECMPAEKLFHEQVSTDPKLRWKSYPKIIEELKAKAKKQGLWMLWANKVQYPEMTAGLTNLEYAVMAEIMGHAIRIAPEATNSSAPDTGNMEVLARYGNAEQKERWLKPLIEGKIRSSFAMTEFGIASSDATNIRTSIVLDEKTNEIVVNGHKWWISGAGDPRNEIHIVMGKSDPKADKYHQQSIVLVPSNTPGVKLVRPMSVFGYDDAPEGHYEVKYENVRVPASNLVLGWGRGFEIIQGRLGPGRLHHCMRSLGLASRSLDLALLRATDERKKTFGKSLFQHGKVVSDLAESRIEIDQSRLLVLAAALVVDKHPERAKGALREIGMAKALVPSTVLRIIDRAMQLHGAEGICQDQPLASMWAGVRTLRYADGPDEVHLDQLGRTELKRVPAVREKYARVQKREEELTKNSHTGSKL